MTEAPSASSVGVALCGYGYWGVNLARSIIASPSTALVAIVESADPLRERALASHTGIDVFDDLAKALMDERIDAVVIATPASSHEDLALQSLESGRHVLVEKPLAMTSTGAESIVSAARRVDRIAMVGHTFLYSAPVHLLRALIRDGDLGTVEYLYSQRLSLGRIRRDCNALWNFAPHDVSIMLHLLDERPIEVSATGFRFIGEQEDVFFASLHFPSGVGANVHVSWIDPRKTRLLTVVGQGKMAIYDDVSVDEKVRIVDAGVDREEGLGSYESLGDFQWRTRAGDIQIPHVRLHEPLLAEVTAFGDACRTGVAPLADARHGADVVRILEAIELSSRERGAPVSLSW